MTPMCKSSTVCHQTKPHGSPGGNKETDRGCIVRQHVCMEGEESLTVIIIRLNIRTAHYPVCHFLGSA